MAYSIKPLSGKNLKRDTAIWTTIPFGLIVVLFVAILICCMCGL